MQRHAWAVLSVALLMAADLRGQELAPATKKAARDMTYEGMAAYGKGEYAAAEQTFARAYALMKVPTIGLWRARALVKLGQLVEASEQYDEVLQLPVGGVPAFQLAQEAAMQEHKALQPRIPGVVIVCERAPAHEVKLTVNGVAVQSALIGVRRPVNPGTITVQGRWRDQLLQREVSVAEGELARVALAFEARPEPVAQKRPASAPKRELVPHKRPRESKARGDGAPVILFGASDGTTQRAMGWMSIGIGGTAVVLGTITLWIALVKRDQLSDDCTDGVCGPSVAEEVGTYNALRWIPVASYIVGGAALASGVALVLLAPDSDEPPKVVRTKAHVEPWIGPASAGLRGWF